MPRKGLWTKLAQVCKDSSSDDTEMDNTVGRREMEEAIDVKRIPDPILANPWKIHETALAQAECERAGQRSVVQHGKIGFDMW